MVVCSSTALAGPECVEPPPGAGSLPGTAFTCPGTGPLKTITGGISSASVAGGPDGDFEDMYLIRICNPKLFCIRTTAMFDTQVWLFQPLDQANPHLGARGLLGNNDTAEGEASSTLFPPATDQTRQEIPAPGLYFVAISAFPNVPLSGPPPMGLIFQFAGHTEISGPDGPGGTQPINAWSAQIAPPPGGGNYMLHLEGAALVDDDLCDNPPYVEDACSDIPAVSEWGLLLLTLLVLVSGAIVLRRVSARSHAL